jgi:hypothetical protein
MSDKQERWDYLCSWLIYKHKIKNKKEVKKENVSKMEEI